MRDGFITCAVASPDVRVADCAYNAQSVISLLLEAKEQGVRLLVLPELVTTSYSCADLFLQKRLQDGSLQALAMILEQSTLCDMLIVLGSMVNVYGSLYNCAVVLKDGKILGVVPKQNLPNYLEFYEKRWFKIPQKGNFEIELLGQKTWFGTHLLFSCNEIPQFVLSCEVCEDLWVPHAVSIDHALSGATVIANSSASNELVGKAEYRRNMISVQSARLVCAYLYSPAGYG
ncbi:MAG: NAD(+) synthase, partial [Spirochaetia bacterium]|nr:NAD(+) synthase [Spirochaetia bacterium]